MLTRFEHDLTVQNILDQLPSITKINNILPSEQPNLPKDEQILDPILTSKKLYDIIDDPRILSDVRLCIDDMLLFLTSTFCQTTRSSISQSSTPLSVSFHDLSLISSTPTSLPPTPTTPHSLFHRSLTRFPSNPSQDHSFNTEHLLRLPSSAFSRSIEPTILTPPLSAQSNISDKKRRKNKNKQQANEVVLNVNNNNNNVMTAKHDTLLQQQQTFSVLLPEDCADFVVIDEQDGIQMNSFR